MTAAIFLFVVTFPAALGRMRSSRTHLTQPSSWGSPANTLIPRMGRKERGKMGFY